MSEPYEPTLTHPIPGFEGYFVSINGKLLFRETPSREANHPGSSQMPPKRTIISASLNKSGYLEARLWAKGKLHVRLIHHLVMLAWGKPRPKCPPNTIARHLNDIKTDNHISNLEWGSVGDNFEDKKANNLKAWLEGNLTKNQRLKPESVRAIKLALINGQSQRSLAREYSVGRSTIQAIALGKTWKNLDSFLKETKE